MNISGIFGEFAILLLITAIYLFRICCSHIYKLMFLQHLFVFNARDCIEPIHLILCKDISHLKKKYNIKQEHPLSFSYS